MTDPAVPSDKSKLGLAVAVIALATGLLFLGRLDGNQWVSTVTWTAALYMVGQVGAVVANGWAVQTQTKAAAQLQSMKSQQ